MMRDRERLTGVVQAPHTRRSPRGVLQNIVWTPILSAFLALLSLVAGVLSFVYDDNSLLRLGLLLALNAVVWAVLALRDDR